MIKHKSSHVSPKIGTGLATALLAPLCSVEYRRLGGADELLCNGRVIFLLEVISLDKSTSFIMLTCCYMLL